MGGSRRVREGRQCFDIENDDLVFEDLRSRLVGRHQINNHAVAIALVRERLKRSHSWPLENVEQRWRDAIARLRWPGRLETISDNPLVIIDVGHTPEGIKAALAGFSRRFCKIVTRSSLPAARRTSMSATCWKFLRRLSNRILCTAAYHNGLAASEVEALSKSRSSRRHHDTVP